MAEDKMIGSSSSSSSSSSSNPKPDQCSICISSCVRKAVMGKCPHSFCYRCIMQWSDNKCGTNSSEPQSLDCPCCKTKSTYVTFQANENLTDTHYFGMPQSECAFFSEGHIFRLKCYKTEIGDLAEKLRVSQNWKRHIISRQIRWIQPWLTREIQALTREEDVLVIMTHIDGSIDAWKRKVVHDSSISVLQGQFRKVVSDAASPFLGEKTEKFINQLELFLGSGLMIDDFDRAYMRHLSPNDGSSNDESETVEQKVRAGFFAKDWYDI